MRGGSSHGMTPLLLATLLTAAGLLTTVHSENLPFQNHGDDENRFQRLKDNKNFIFDLPGESKDKDAGQGAGAGGQGMLGIIGNNQQAAQPHAQQKKLGNQGAQDIQAAAPANKAFIFNQDRAPVPANPDPLANQNLKGIGETFNNQVVDKDILRYYQKKAESPNKIAADKNSENFAEQNLQQNNVVRMEAQQVGGAPNVGGGVEGGVKVVKIRKEKIDNGRGPLLSTIDGK